MVNVLISVHGCSPFAHNAVSFRQRCH